MTWLALLYFGIGSILAVVVHRRNRDPISAVLCLMLWPLWAPFALQNESQPLGDHERSNRIATALRQGMASVSGTPMSNLLTQQAVDQILGEVERAESRRQELDEVLARRDLDLDRARDRTRTTDSSAAKLHLANVERLHRLRAQDERALDELEELVTALGAQLALARYAGSSTEGADGIVTEVWARVEGLSVAMDATSEGSLGKYV